MSKHTPENTILISIENGIARVENLPEGVDHVYVRVYDGLKGMPVMCLHEDEGGHEFLPLPTAFYPPQVTWPNDMGIEDLFSETLANDDSMI